MASIASIVRVAFIVASALIAFEVAMRSVAGGSDGAASFGIEAASFFLAPHHG
jgi:hypothetical protein